MAVHEHLWCKSPVGGMARYTNDYYHQVSQDVANVPGNPWFICTLWWADYLIATAKTEDDLRPALAILVTITALRDWISINARRLTLLRDVATISNGLMTPTLARLLAGRGDDELDRDCYLAEAAAEAKDIADSTHRQFAQILDELIAGRPDPEAPVEVELRPGVRKAVPWGTQLLSCELHAADVEGCLRRSGIAGSAWQIEKVDFVAWIVELRHGKELTTYKIPQGVRQNFAGAFLAFTDAVNPEAGARIRVQLLRRALVPRPHALAPRRERPSGSAPTGTGARASRGRWSPRRCQSPGAALHP